MKLVTLILIALVGLTEVFANIDHDWEQFKKDFNKNYQTTEEEAFRKEIFIKSLKIIENHNKNFENGLVTYEMGLNELSDSTDEEYKTMLFNENFPYEEFEQFDNFQKFNSPKIPDYVNWVERGFNNTILNQGSCGSCYAFAGVAALEGQYFIKYGKLINLSHQELVDCGKYFGNYGCKGGFQVNIYRYMLRHGLGHSSSNPYLGRENRCKKGEPRITIKGYKGVPRGDEETLKATVALIGPIPVDMHASGSFRYYKSGILYDPNCNPNYLSHAVTVVGYGTENGQDYWLVRNSWGSRWGQNGYIKMSRNRNNNCGIASRAVYPIIS